MLKRGGSGLSFKVPSYTEDHQLVIAIGAEHAYEQAIPSRSQRCVVDQFSMTGNLRAKLSVVVAEVLRFYLCHT